MERKPWDHPLPAHALETLGASYKRNPRRARLMLPRTIAKKLGYLLPPASPCAQPGASGISSELEQLMEKRARKKRTARAAAAAKKRAKREEHEALLAEVQQRTEAQFRERLAGAALGSNVYAFNDTWLVDVLWGQHDGVTYYTCEAVRGGEHLGESDLGTLPRLAIHGGDYGMVEELVDTIRCLAEPRFYHSARVWHNDRIGGCTCCSPRQRAPRAADVQERIEVAVFFNND